MRKYSRLLTPFNGLIDQLHHCVAGTFQCDIKVAIGNFILLWIFIPTLGKSSVKKLIA